MVFLWSIKDVMSQMENFTPRPARAVPGAERKQAPEVAAKVQPMQQGSIPPQKRQSPKQGRLFIWISVILAAALVVAGGWYVLRGMFASSGIDSSKFQAVFLTSGQVYFGRMQVLNDNYIKLTDVFYIQADTAAADSQNPQDANSDSSNSMQLIKLGNEVHGPEDAMIISRDQILFYENLREDGKVVQIIKQSQEK